MTEQLTTGDRDLKPVFGQILLGGGGSGALVRDMRLANELAERGYRVHVWWVMDRWNHQSLHPSITQSVLFNGFRYAGSENRLVRAGRELVGRVACRIFSERSRLHFTQRRFQTIERMMGKYMSLIGQGVEHDPVVLDRFRSDIEKHQITHILPMLSVLGGYLPAVRAKLTNPPKQLLTFQGYELYIHYAREVSDELAEQVYRRLREAAIASDYPSIAVSADYLERVIEEVGVPRESLVAIPPGVPVPEPLDKAKALAHVASELTKIDPELPIVTYLGRQDVEKGIDLLLYAAKLLQTRGVKFQVVIAGQTLWGEYYRKTCRRISDDLQCKVIWQKRIDDELRDALFAASRCVVYPSIHREPFGMVAAEASSFSTPVVVPDYGGVATAMEAEGRRSGVTFKVWDSGDLADQIERLLTDDALHAELSANGRFVAEYYSVARLTDRVLGHLGLGNAGQDATERG